MQEKRDIYIYRIDGNDIVFYVSENWETFAKANAWDGGCSPKDVLGRPLFEFFDGLEVKYLYEQLFNRVRAGKPLSPIPFRCDSPEERRHLTLSLSPLPNGGIEFASEIVRVEARDPCQLLDASTQRSRKLLAICSMCKKIKISEGRWDPIEEGLTQIGVFESNEMPRLTHGICPDCYRLTMNQLDKTTT